MSEVQTQRFAQLPFLLLKGSQTTNVLHKVCLRVKNTKTQSTKI